MRFPIHLDFAWFWQRMHLRAFCFCRIDSLESVFSPFLRSFRVKKRPILRNSKIGTWADQIAKLLSELWGILFNLPTTSKWWRSKAWINNPISFSLRLQFPLNLVLKIESTAHRQAVMSTLVAHPFRSPYLTLNGSFFPE